MRSEKEGLHKQHMSHWSPRKALHKQQPRGRRDTPDPSYQAAGKKRVLLAMAAPLCGRFDTSSALSRVAARAASARSSGARAPRHAHLIILCKGV